MRRGSNRCFESTKFVLAQGVLRPPLKCKQLVKQERAQKETKMTQRKAKTSSAKLPLITPKGKRNYNVKDKS